MLPLDLSEIGPLAAGFLSLGIGFGFGFVLESAGFGDSRKLTSQFHLDDQTVIKVMFSAVVVALVLITASALSGVIDVNRIFVPETYFGPAIVGGLLLGCGFYIGGF